MSEKCGTCESITSNEHCNNPDSVHYKHKVAPGHIQCSRWGKAEALGVAEEMRLEADFTGSQDILRWADECEAKDKLIADANKRAMELTRGLGDIANHPHISADGTVSDYMRGFVEAHKNLGGIAQKVLDDLNPAQKRHEGD